MIGSPILPVPIHAGRLAVVSIVGLLCLRSAAGIARRLRWPSRRGRLRLRRSLRLPVVAGALTALAAHAVAPAWAEAAEDDNPDDRSLLPAPRGTPGSAPERAPPETSPPSSTDPKPPTSTVAPSDSTPAPPAAPEAPAAPTRPDSQQTVEVRAGDCLWAIAEASLAPSATDADIDRYWRRIYDLNRDVVGPDPDLIRPGQVLVVPPPH